MSTNSSSVGRVREGSGRIGAPWDDATVAGLTAWQQASHVHPFTHDCGSVLRATPDGWVCPDIGCTAYDGPDTPYPSVVQTWAYRFMADGPPPDRLAWYRSAPPTEERPDEQ